MSLKICVFVLQMEPWVTSRTGLNQRGRQSREDKGRRPLDTQPGRFMEKLCPVVWEVSAIKSTISPGSEQDKAPRDTSEVCAHWLPCHRALKALEVERSTGPLDTHIWPGLTTHWTLFNCPPHTPTTLDP